MVGGTNGPIPRTKGQTSIGRNIKVTKIGKLKIRKSLLNKGTIVGTIREEGEIQKNSRRVGKTTEKAATTCEITIGKGTGEHDIIFT